MSLLVQWYSTQCKRASSYSIVPRMSTMPKNISKRPEFKTEWLGATLWENIPEARNKSVKQEVDGTWLSYVGKKVLCSMYTSGLYFVPLPCL